MIRPENPLRVMPGKNITDVNSAYWLAVKYLLVRLDKKAIKTVPENPNAKLSALIVKTKAGRLGPALFKNKKNRLVTVNRMLLIISNLLIP